MVLMRVEQQLPTLVGLVSVKPPFDLPLSGWSGDFFHAFNPSDSGIEVGVACEAHRQSAAKNVELPWGGLQDQHRAVLCKDVLRRPGSGEASLEEISSQRDRLC